MEIFSNTNDSMFQDLFNTANVKNILMVRVIYLKHKINSRNVLFPLNGLKEREKKNHTWKAFFFKPDWQGKYFRDVYLSM